MQEKILLSLAHMGGSEQKWIEEAFRENWIVPLGPNVDEFEYLLGNYLNHGKVVALSAGTAALHLGLVMLGVEKDDEVICQSLTFSASANPIKYQGATPVFVDSEPDTWNMSPEILEEAIQDRFKKKGRYPKAIIPVHLYGMPAKMDEITAISKKYNIPMLEDAAEALGSEYNGLKCGTIGDFGALSFNGNKIITTSGGGALICPNEKTAQRVKFYATQARENRPYYYHEVVGYNYRLSNVSAGIGCGQMDVLNDHVARRREIHDIYTSALSTIEGIHVHENPNSKFNSNYWLTTILINPKVITKTPDQIRLSLYEENIETRLLWRPMNMQPVFKDAPYYGGAVAEDLFNKGLCLPSGSNLSNNDIDRVINSLIHAIN